MMLEHAAIGVRPVEFWQLSPRESHALFAGAHRARIAERQLVLWGAWHNEAFARAKRLPSIAQLLENLEPKHVMDASEARAKLLAIANAMGAKIVRH
jgi:hypothetical protein